MRRLKSQHKPPTRLTISRVEKMQMATDMCEFRFDGIMAQVSINLKPHIIKQIDDERGEQSRSSFIADCVVAYFEPRGEADKKDIARLESEVNYLRDQNARLTDAVAVKLLSEPKKSFWARIRGR